MCCAASIEKSTQGAETHDPPICVYKDREMTATVGTTPPGLAKAAQVLVCDYMAVTGEENVLITADTAGDPRVYQALMRAAEDAGAKASILMLSQLPFQGRLADPYLTPTLSAAVLASDVWLDVTFPYLAGSALYDQAIEMKQLRYLLGADMSAEGLVRLFGRVDLDQYHAVHSGFDKFIDDATGKLVRITDGGGTDVQFRLAERPYHKPRRADAPGAYLVPGACTMFPDIESVQGEIVVRSIFHEYYTALNSPLTLQVDGQIQSISGGGNERTVAERALRRAGGGDYGYIIHFTHGIHPAARITGRSFIEDMRCTGNDAIGMGLPWWQPGGGENHPDGIVTMQTIEVDGLMIVAEGNIVAPSALAKQAAELLPTFN